jgi:uncharacterized protein (TIGR03067 family)
MRSRHLLPLAALLALAAAGFAPVPKPKDHSGPYRKELQGTWRVVSIEHGDRDSHLDKPYRQTMRIDGDRVFQSVQARKGGPVLRAPVGRLVLDARRDPPWFSIQRSAPSGLVVKGVFKLEKYALLWTYNARNFGKRPARADGPLGPTEIRVTFRRVESADEKR